MAASSTVLTPSQLDRAEGVLLAQAVGDAMGVPYEPGDVPLTGAPEMLGGGYGDYAPAEWSDDTQMSLYVAEVAATGADLTSEEALDEIARGWCRWVVEDGATDVGTQTRRVIDAVAATRDEPGIAARMHEAAAALHASTGRTAGNGALMRNGIVGLTRLDEPKATAAAARAVAELTHADPLAGDSCVLQAEIIRGNVAGPEWAGMPYSGAPVLRAIELLPAERQGYWHELFDGGAYDPAVWAVAGAPEPDGFTVDALGKAVLAFTQANYSARDEGFFSVDRAATAARWMSAVLRHALEGSQDKDTVAAIAGAMAGSYLGADAVPAEWVGAVHGLPRRSDGVERRAEDLRELARATALAGLGA